MSEYIIHYKDAETLYEHTDLPFLLDEYLREKIVRCENCKYHELQTVSYSDKVLSVCTAEWCEGAEGDNPLVEPDGFCAWGERLNIYEK